MTELGDRLQHDTAGCEYIAVRKCECARRARWPSRHPAINGPSLGGPGPERAKLTFRLTQIGGPEPFRESRIDVSKQGSGFVGAPMICPQAAQRNCGKQFPSQSGLLPGGGERAHQ